ncbi:MAG: hypothetical protein Kow00128_24010 [Deltaproteobacteria bacterium]
MTLRSRIRTTYPLPPVLLILLLLGLSVPLAPFAEEPEVLKGTIQKVEADALYLMDVSFPDETIPRRDIRVLVGPDTRYFYGTKRIPKEEAAVGHRVLVRCTLVGSSRKALLVRVIGGKKAVP